MKNTNKDEKKITRIPAWLQVISTLAFPPAGAVMIMIDKAGEKKEKEIKLAEDRAVDELLDDVIEKCKKSEVTPIDSTESVE